MSMHHWLTVWSTMLCFSCSAEMFTSQVDPRVSGPVQNSKLVHVNSLFQCPIHNVLFFCCCSLCILHTHVMFTRLYTFEYTFNNMEDVNAVFEHSTFGVIMSRIGPGWKFGGQLKSDHGKCAHEQLCFQSSVWDIMITNCTVVCSHKLFIRPIPTSLSKYYRA